ncbi:hypothetical protein [Solirubrobacter soli]|uniref:hypothetical protein n=1 Tax=Solirubrobacter soli TaxID=363832 RepID=UPI000426CD99|nr:hypothetical protein [Solirubrobacter soli]
MATAALAIATPAIATARERLPYLTVKDTRAYLKSAFRSDFGSDYRDSTERYIDACTRRPKLASRPGRVRCNSVGWRLGDVVFEGGASVWYRHNDEGEVRWWYSYSITETDEACLDAGGSDAECIISHDV